MSGVRAACIANPNEWQVIEAGAARDKSVFDQTDFIQSLPVHYHQENKPYCTAYSMLSALWLFGDIRVPDLLLENLEALVHVSSGVHNRDGRCPRMAAIRDLFSSKAKKLYDVKSFYTRRCNYGSTASELRTLAPDKHDILLVQLMGSDGSINHAVALVWANDGHGGRAQFIIDSNEEFAVQSSERALALVNNSTAVLGWKMVLCLHPKPSIVNSSARLARTKLLC